MRGLHSSFWPPGVPLWAAAFGRPVGVSRLLPTVQHTPSSHRLCTALQVGGRCTVHKVGPPCIAHFAPLLSLLPWTSSLCSESMFERALLPSSGARFDAPAEGLRSPILTTFPPFTRSDRRTTTPNLQLRESEPKRRTAPVFLPAPAPARPAPAPAAV